MSNKDQEKKEMIDALSAKKEGTVDDFNSLVKYAVGWTYELRERSHDFKEFRQTAENFFKFMIDSNDEMKASHSELKKAQEEGTKAVIEINTTARTSLTWLKFIVGLGLAGWAAESGIFHATAEFIKGLLL